MSDEKINGDQLMELIVNVNKKQEQLKVASRLVKRFFMEGLGAWFEGNYLEAAHAFGDALFFGGTNNDIRHRPSENLILMMAIDSYRSGGYTDEHSLLWVYEEKRKKLLAVKGSYVTLEEMV